MGEEKEWEYCSPPGEVLDTAYTVNGQDCVGECGTQGEKYWWCQKSPKVITHTGKSAAKDHDWDYCSPNSQSTRWCDKSPKFVGHNGKNVVVDHNWDYCSPISSTRYNEPCSDACES